MMMVALQCLTYILGVMNAEVCDSRSWTSLMIAARNGQVKVAKYLLKTGYETKNVLPGD